MNTRLLPLTELKDGASARVENILGGHAFLKRLSAMGIMPGEQLLKEFGQGHGPVVVLVRGARLALGRGMASKIILRAGAK